MAKCTISNGIETITGALKKTTEPVPKLCESGVSKRKESESTDETGINAGLMDKGHRMTSGTMDDSIAH